MDLMKIGYDFAFHNGAAKKFDIELDRETLSLITGRKQDPPAWALLEYQQCANCRSTMFPYLLSCSRQSFGIVQEFREVTSNDKVDVTVTVKERIYFKTTSIQEG